MQGASVIRMLKHYLGEETFKAGITVSQSSLLSVLAICVCECFFQHYLNSHTYGNAETYQLWEALQSKVWICVLFLLQIDDNASL